MDKNVFVMGLTDLQRGELETVRGAEKYRFHTLLTYERLVGDEEPDFEQLLEESREELRRFDGSVDALVAHWDFPTSLLVPVLAHELGLPAPSLASLVKSEHKYWSRLEQQASVPECVPRFCAFDPFTEDPLTQVDLEFPFWVKPVKAHSSTLGFEVHDEQQFHEAVQEIRAEIGGLGDAFEQVLKRLELPPEIDGLTGTTCLAEQLISGMQAAPEGTMFQGEFHVHGVFDMHKDEAGTSFERLEYPATSVPEQVQLRMVDVSERYLRHVGFDNGCFNAEFMWDEANDKLWLVEVNTRVSQAHSDLFAKVDGASNHEVAIDIALGQRPSMPHRQGRFAVAGQCMIFHDRDAVVTKVPSEAELEEIARRFPETEVTLQVRPGDRLSETPHQGSYRYIVAKAYIGAGDREELVRKHRAVAEALPFEFEDIEEDVTPV